MRVGGWRVQRVFAYGAPVDMRKGYEGLSALVRRELGELLCGDCFLFVGRTRRNAKVLHFDGTGLCLYSKRMEKGRFAALWGPTARRRLEMTLSELSLFLEGNQLVAYVALSPASLSEKELAVDCGL